MSIHNLQQKLKPEYRFNISSLKHWVEQLVIILRTMIENNPNNSAI